MNMDYGCKCRTLMVPPCGMMNGGQKWLVVRYGWSRWLVNMPIQTKGDSCGGMQIGVNSQKFSKTLWLKCETRVLLKDRGKKIESNGANDVPNGCRMALQC